MYKKKSRILLQEWHVWLDLGREIFSTNSHNQLTYKMEFDIFLVAHALVIPFNNNLVNNVNDVFLLLRIYF